jgi:hypothetical protein
MPPCCWPARRKRRWTRPRSADRLDEARAELRRFHHRLCSLRVLDPACGSGNFLYVTLEHLKRLEGEVLDQLAPWATAPGAAGPGGETVTLQQLRGIELNPRAAALAELVLWIGYLQWQIRTFGPAAWPSRSCTTTATSIAAMPCWPGMHRNRHDADGSPDALGWRRPTSRTRSPASEVPDEAAQVPQWRYLNPRPAEWPQADFIVGNPPFIGSKRMRAALGDGYVDALRRLARMCPRGDFVMYWWDQGRRSGCRQVAQRAWA